MACSDCHTKRPERPATIAYRFDDLSCEACHLDPHGGQFRTGVAGKSGPAFTGCASCHNVGTWRKLSKFDHSATRYPLTGAHRGVACDLCHKATPLSRGLRRVTYRDAASTCAGCHEDIHAGQFKTATWQPDCDVCHNNSKWRVAAFDHSKTSFPLTGAHAQAACRDCHKNKQEVNGRLILFYKPEPKECASCHAATVHQ